MQVIYKPRLNPDYSPIPGQTVALAILLPTPYDPNKKYPWELLVHGMGERSGGTLENLQNLVLGQKQADGSRKYPFVKDFQKEVVDKYGIILVVPTYNDFFDVSEISWTHDFILKNYSVVYQMAAGGFSLGGGAIVAYAKSTVENAKKMAVAFPCAPTYQSGNSSAPGQANLPMHLFVNDKDDNGATNIEVTKKIVSEINATNPKIKAQFTAFRKDGHGSYDEATTITPPVAPGGQGIINLTESVHQWYLDVLANGPRQIKSGTAQPAPDPDPEPPPVVLKAEFNLTDKQVIAETFFDVDASASTGVKSGWDAYAWDVSVIRASSDKSYGVRPEGGMYDSDPKKRLVGLVDGEYSVRLTVKNSAGLTNSKVVTIIVNQSGIKIAIGFNSETDLITYSDGTTEKGTAVLSSGKWTVKNSAGQEVSL